MKFKRTLVNVAIMASLVAIMQANADTEKATDHFKQTVDNTKKNIMSSLDEGMNNVSEYSNDSSITARVKRMFMENKSLPSKDISVTTTAGTVTLTGFVHNEEQRLMAIDLTRNLKGVKAVNDQLSIKGNSDRDKSLSGYIDDASITADIKAKLFITDDIPSNDINVVTTDGVVQLTGSVNTTAQSEAAEALVKQIKGVKSVENKLAITS